MLKLIYTAIILCLFASCGKKAQEQKNQVETSTNFGTVFNEQEELNKSLKKAVKSNDIETVKDIVKNRRSELKLNFIYEDGETLLITAIKNDFQEIRDYLISLGVNINRPNSQNETPLIIAAQFGRENSVKKLIFEKAKLDLKDDSGNTALLWAIKSKYPQIALYIIHSGADITITNNEAKNAYRLAIENSANELIEILRSLTNLSVGTIDVLTFTNLLKQGDSFHLRRALQQFPGIAEVYKGVNPLVVVLESKMTNATATMAQDLIDNGVSVNGPPNAEVTPLIKSIQLKNEYFIEFFLSHKPDVNLIDKSGKSALIHAVEKNLPEIAISLINLGAKKSYRIEDEEKNTLHINACEVAREIRKTLKLPDELTKNSLIKDHLECGLRFLPFI